MIWPEQFELLMHLMSVVFIEVTRISTNLQNECENGKTVVMRTTHPPAGLSPVFAIVVCVIVWVTERQRDKVLSGRRKHFLTWADSQRSQKLY